MTHIKEAMKAKAQEFAAYEIVYPAGKRKIDLLLLYAFEQEGVSSN